MPVVNMLDAKTRLSKLVEAVESGAESEIVIARNGKPAARLVPISAPPVTKGVKFGLLEGRYAAMSLEKFNAADEEIADLFLKDSDH